jgi:hypothetical protein
MKIDSEAKDSQRADVLVDHSAELAAYRAILQNLLLEVARETGAERLAALRDGALGALSPASEGREQSAAIVEATFDLVATEAGFSALSDRNLH